MPAILQLAGSGAAGAPPVVSLCGGMARAATEFHFYFTRGMAARKKGRAAGMGRLRIIAGRWRGRRLPVPALPGLRPTPDRVRETLFNWLAPDLEGLKVLDLFAGSGALAFEALSRGAATAVLVERDRRACRQLEASRAELGASCHIVGDDVLGFLRRDTGRYDLVFVDPPFAAELWLPVLQALPARLAPGHRVYLETPRRWAGALPAGWRLHKEKAVADVAMRLLDYSAPETSDHEPQDGRGE